MDYDHYGDNLSNNTRSNYIGFSSHINDKAFEKYLKNTNSWSAIFSVILAFASVVGFLIYGETSTEMGNPEAIYIGLGVGGMFLLIALFTIMSRGKSKTWDGSNSCYRFFYMDDFKIG